MGVLINYGEVAVGAKTDTNVEVAQKDNFTDFSNEELLKQNDVKFSAITNPCEMYSAALDGKCSVFPDNTDNNNFGLWSKDISGADGKFTKPLSITFTLSKAYDVAGITLVCDEVNNIYCNDLSIVFTDESGAVTTKNYAPTSASYFCDANIEKLIKAVVTFKGTNVPNNRLRLHSVEYGKARAFSRSSLKNVRLIQQINPISTEIYISTVDFDFITDTAPDIQRNQPVSVSFNNTHIATAFVKEYKRKSKTLWHIEAEDYIGILEDTTFAGGIYDGTMVQDLLKEILTDTADVPYEIDRSASAIMSQKVYGHIPYSNCRSALMQVCFAVGLIVDTSYSQEVVIKTLDNGDSTEISQNRIMQGETINEKTETAKVQVTAHSYTKTPSVNGGEEITIYDASTDGTGTSIEVQLSEPCYDFTYTGTGEIIDRSNANYVIFNASSNDFVLKGKKYYHTTFTQTKTNSNATKYGTTISVENATLVSKYNITAVLDRCYDYYIKLQSASLKIVEDRKGEPLRIGDKISFENIFGDTTEGNIVKHTFALNSSIIVKETEVE